MRAGERVAREPENKRDAGSTRVLRDLRYDACTWPPSLIFRRIRDYSQSRAFSTEVSKTKPTAVEKTPQFFFYSAFRSLTDMVKA